MIMRLYDHLLTLGHTIIHLTPVRTIILLTLVHTIIRLIFVHKIVHLILVRTTVLLISSIGLFISYSYITILPKPNLQ